MKGASVPRGTKRIMRLLCWRWALSPWCHVANAEWETGIENHLCGYFMVNIEHFVPDWEGDFLVASFTTDVVFVAFLIFGFLWVTFSLFSFVMCIQWLKFDKNVHFFNGQDLKQFSRFARLRLQYNVAFSCNTCRLHLWYAWLMRFSDIEICDMIGVEAKPCHNVNRNA